MLTTSQLGAAGLSAEAVEHRVALRGRIPDPASVVTVLAHVDPRWLAVAVGAQFLSQASFALQQRTLLAAVGPRLTVADSLAITFSRTAMGSVLPAGSAMSAAFALQQFRRRGATAAREQEDTKDRRHRRGIPRQRPCWEP